MAERERGGGGGGGVATGFSSSNSNGSVASCAGGALGALGDPLVKAAFAVPPGAFDDLAGAPTDAIPIPFDPSLLSDIQIVGFAADKEADLVTVTLTLEYASASSAEAASEYFGALLTLAGPFIPPGAAADLLSQIAVEYSGSTVEVSISATVDQLSAAADEVGSSMVPE